MRLRINPESWPSVANATRSAPRTSAAGEIAVLALGTAAGATIGALLGKTKSTAGIGAGLGLGVAIALVVTAEDEP